MDGHGAHGCRCVTEYQEEHTDTSSSVNGRLLKDKTKDYVSRRDRRRDR
jgi:hypothetical protein